MEDVTHILSKLSPELYPEPYVFALAKANTLVDTTDAFAIVKEEEGITLVLTKKRAEQKKLDYTYEAARISLALHTDLNLVGLTAVISGILAEAGISCNVTAGYHHDHLFVPFSKGAEALQRITHKMHFSDENP